MKQLLSGLDSIKLSEELRRGIEKESLRVTKKGLISKKNHFEALGSALTHPYITTDYSEALLEFVTPVFNDAKELLTFLEELHIYTLKQMGDEVLWSNSMPCFLEKNEQIPIARYGTSNVGKMKTVYRNGLLHRYGSAMQAISGIHFNFSLTDKFFEKYREIKEEVGPLRDFKSKCYMNAARNIHKYSWIIPFVFGSSPAICKSFLNKAPKEYDLLEFDSKGTLYYKGATSLRLSNLGYTNSEQGKINVCYNDIYSYVKGLREAVTTSEPLFEKIGIKDNDHYKQLNTNVLQIENEYYAVVRPKRIAKSGESPSSALLERGVEYLELRSVDVNAFSPIGIDLDQLYFLDVFLLYCLLEEHDGLCPERTKRFRDNQEKVARHGRETGLTLFNGKEEVNAVDWACELFSEFTALADHLDRERGGAEYRQSVQKFHSTIKNTSLLYSERILDEMRESNQCFFTYTMNKSIEYSNKLKTLQLDPSKEKFLDQMARESLLKQKKIEDEDDMSFETYLANYFRQNLTIQEG